MFQAHLLLFLCCYGFYVAAAQPSPPLITKQPETKVIRFQLADIPSGDIKPIIIECEAEGEPAPTYRWIKNNKPFDYQAYDDRMLIQSGRGTLIITIPRAEDVGQYQCFATNEFGTATSNSVLVRTDQDYLVLSQNKYNTLPFFTKEPEVTNAAEGDNAVLHCTARGTPEPDIKWIFNGKSIYEAPDNNRRTVTTNSITITNLIKSDTGNYGCNASNNAGYVYRDVYLNVLTDVSPEFVMQPDTQATMIGRNVILKCKAFGAPKPEIRWIKDRTDLTSDRYKRTNNGNLEITDVIFSDAGEYRCLASNKFGSKTRIVTLSLKQPTVIVNGPRNLEVTINHDVTFTCEAVADTDLKLKVDWLKDGGPINYGNSRYRKYIKSGDSTRGIHHLKVSKMVETDAGKYTCVAHTDLDRIEASANVIILDVPDAR